RRSLSFPSTTLFRSVGMVGLQDVDGMQQAGAQAAAILRAQQHAVAEHLAARGRIAEHAAQFLFHELLAADGGAAQQRVVVAPEIDRKSTRLNSSHVK